MASRGLLSFVAVASPFHSPSLLQPRQFVLINYSHYRELEPYHGRTVNLKADDKHMPLQSLFLFHEMRVRGRWPLKYDRNIALPLQQQQWMSTADDDIDTDTDRDGDGGDGTDREHHSGDTDIMSDVTPTSSFTQGQSGGSLQQQSQSSDRSLHHPAAGPAHRTITITSPFTNRAELEGLRRSFTQEPNWIATLIENESWGGTSEENAAKWRNLRMLES
jgi:hypothetical protein